MIDSMHFKADLLASARNEKADYLCSHGKCNKKIHASETAEVRLIALLLTGGGAHGYPIATRPIAEQSRQSIGSAPLPTATTNCARTGERGTQLVTPTTARGFRLLRFETLLYRPRWSSRAPSSG